MMKLLHRRQLEEISSFSLYPKLKDIEDKGSMRYKYQIILPNPGPKSQKPKAKALFLAAPFGFS